MQQRCVSNMAYLSSVGTSIPEHNLSQEEVKQLITEIFPASERKINRLLSVFDHALIENRQFVVEPDWYKKEHSFKERNDLYQQLAKKHMVEAVMNCLTDQHAYTADISPSEVDMIIFVSSTGISTPSMEVELFNDLPFREDIYRMPLWGLGCAGGAIGLSRAFDWLRAHPEKTALVICLELCSLTFQKHDIKKSNIVGTALFGDGSAAALAVGEKSPLLKRVKRKMPRIITTDSRTKKHSQDVMGWNVSNTGLEVIFAKSIPQLVESFWKEHIYSFLHKTSLAEKHIHSFIAHPGGKKVLEAMEDVLETKKSKLSSSYEILRKHGNMSSATVLYVLGDMLRRKVDENEISILSALGPGFSSELLLMEWK
ncbi:type III polyketide synthase [Virgibacillus xinjiangensis]|uniref:Type III polyketide synthase n=1 Tax=Virgibacillus xinjiangensis TaxID=393090 RepID=A0ABV7CRK0_9BACI